MSEQTRHDENEQRAARWNSRPQVKLTLELTDEPGEFPDLGPAAITGKETEQ